MLTPTTEILIMALVTAFAAFIGYRQVRKM